MSLSEKKPLLTSPNLKSPDGLLWSEVISGTTKSIPFLAFIAFGVAFFLTMGVTMVRHGDTREYRGILEQQQELHGDVSGVKDIEIGQGTLRGFLKQSRQGRSYYAFYKVPYAEPPVEKLRLMDPIPPQSTWSGIRAETVMPECIQKEKSLNRTFGQEDCLYANIFVPVANDSSEDVRPLPVMLFMHGGQFKRGSANRYSADYFMDEDVVLVMFNYRLGPFGFIQHGEILGNMGFKDQVEMLRWIQLNIGHFGGDPNRVTVFGNSAGGFSSSFLMLSPMATGLFHRAIVQSGANVCAGSAFQINRDPTRPIQRLGRALNCDTSNSTRFLECIQNKNASDIALVETPVTEPYALTIERRNDSQVFMPDEPYQILKTNPHRIPIIIGIANSERAGEALDILSDPDTVTNLNENFPETASVLLFTQLKDDEFLSIKEFYFGANRIDNGTFLDMANLDTDRVFGHCSYVSAIMHSEFSSTYLYVVSKPPEKSEAGRKRQGFPFKKLGLVSHGDEVQYQFPHEDFPVITKDDPEHFEFSKLFNKLFVQFAATGSPHPDWPPVSRRLKSSFWYDLNDTPNINSKIQERMEFWNQFSHKQLNYDIS